MPENAAVHGDLLRVTAAADGVEVAGTNLHAAVARARRDGATWRQVGLALSITRQAAWERFSASSVADSGR